MIGLTGASHHLTGHAGEPLDVHLDSISHMVIGKIAKALAETDNDSIPDTRKLSMDTASALAFVSQRIESKARMLEFTARTMDIEDVANKAWGEPYREHTANITKVLLASPLYIALPE
jgi:hypothetical protein